MKQEGKKYRYFIIEALNSKEENIIRYRANMEENIKEAFSLMHSKGELLLIDTQENGWFSLLLNKWIITPMEECDFSLLIKKPSY